jgi:NADH dehydrogenase
MTTLPTKIEKHIVILGAGFAGIQSAIALEKQLNSNSNIKITLVDKRDYQLFTSNLFEVATSEEELVSIEQIKKSITLPISEILFGKKVNFIKKEVKEILPVEKKLVFENGELKYDYLVMALGSQSDFFNIKGAKEYSLTLKSLPDALRIRNQIEFAVQSRQMDINKKVVRIVIAGGGYTGLELAGELRGLINILSLKYSYPKEKIEIKVIEASNKLIPGFDDRLSIDAYNRLSYLGISVSVSAKITEVDNHFVFLETGEKLAYDCLIWTTGIKATDMHFNISMNLDMKGRILVNEYLQSKNFPEIFALGDNACILDKNNHPVPATAQDAIHEARYLAKSILSFMQNKLPNKTYIPKKHGFIVSLGGKWAIMSYNGVYLTGYLAWVVDQIAHIRYYTSVVGLIKAIKYVVFQVGLYSRND